MQERVGSMRRAEAFSLRALGAGGGRRKAVVSEAVMFTRPDFDHAGSIG